MNDYAPLHIINTFLLDGMKVVGELFGSGQMQLPFVLQSAETMKSAVAHLEPHMETLEGESTSKGKFLIATVKGDVHDIGKNLVDIILTNNGYEVVNLGIKQSCDAIVDAQKEHQADCLAMSGLLVKSTAFMKDNLSAFNEAGIDVPVILGGAALTPRFVQKDCRDVYNGKVIYGRDAFADLRFMDALMDAKKKDNWSNLSGFLADAPEGVGLDEATSNDSDQASAPAEASEPEQPQSQQPVSTERSSAVPPEPIPVAPFLGSAVLTEADLDLQEVFTYLDRNALFAGQWQFRKTKDQSRDDYDAMLAEKAEPVLKLWIDRCLNESLLAPGAVYGYFPVGRDGNALRVFSADQTTELGRFDLPRQRSGNRYCIADFFSDVRLMGHPPMYCRCRRSPWAKRPASWLRSCLKATNTAITSTSMVWRSRWPRRWLSGFTHGSARNWALLIRLECLCVMSWHSDIEVAAIPSDTQRVQMSPTLVSNSSGWMPIALVSRWMPATSCRQNKARQL
jgi:5-methyltetrahydrofolate--homocysteine methyltransferase